MPSAQVVNFGEDPYANAMGGFAKNFLGEINEKAGQRRNENIFQKIKEKYGTDAKPEDIFRDVLEHEGFDQEFKRNKLNEIKEYASIATKGKTTPYQKAMLDIRQEELNLKKKKAENGEGEKSITPYQKKVLKNQETRLALERQRLEQAAKTNDKKLPEYVDKYTSSLLKNAEEKLPAHDKADLNAFVEELMSDEENPMSVNDAFNRAYDYIQARREKIDTVKITPRPSAWFGDRPKELAETQEKAYQELKALHDEDGIDNQKELRAVAERAGWKPEEITEMLKAIFKGAGKALRGAPRKEINPEQSAQIPFEEQGATSQAAGLDDILFGE
jgi:hypothetical protein